MSRAGGPPGGGRAEGEKGRPRILVADREPAVRSLLSRLLTDSGFAVEAVLDGATALDACRRDSFELAMIDLHLRGINGCELASIMANRWPDTAVVMMGAAGDVATAVESLRAGAYDYLTKPLEMTEIVLRVGRALERRRLILDRGRHQRELEAVARRETRSARRVFLGAIKSLCSALEAKDDYTRGHSERVSVLAGKIAGAIGIGRREAGRIRLAGRLHDIGKIGVREAVLAKPYSLTEDEYRHIQTHPVIGERILAQGIIDPETLRIVRHHHEHYGGEGYPDGLRGSAIPLGARVLAVADAFDALTSDRPYRGRLDVQAALDVLRGGAGPQWQPTLVEALRLHIVELPRKAEEGPGRLRPGPGEP